MAMFENQADRLCMTPEVITGDKLPGNATVRGQVMSLNMANSSFKSARDRLGFRLFVILTKKILPAEMKKWNDEDILEITENDTDVQMFDQIFINFKLNQFIAKNFRMGKNPSRQDKARYMEGLIKDLELKGRRLPGMKDFFKDLEINFKMNPTGENVNKEQRNEAMTVALGMFQANPAIINIPLFRQYLVENEISPFKLTTGQMQEYMAMQSGKQEQSNQLKQDAILSQVNNQ
jgi:hypothetical protein